MKNILVLLVTGMAAFSAIGQQQRWHELEGYFQFSRNKEQYVRFTRQDTMLVARLLWNNVEIHLLPDTGLSFVSKESEEGGPIHIGFIRDASGMVNQVRVANSGIWIRVINYMPHVKKATAHSPEQLRKFAGLYRMKRDTALYMQLGVDSNTLTMHRLWDGNVIDNLVPETELKFFKVENPTFTLNFTLDRNGQVTRFLVNGQEAWIRLGEQHISPGYIKSCEGKYRSKDDPDNEVRLIVTDSGLIVKQLWDEKAIRVDPITQSFSYNKQQAYPLNIIADSMGKVTGILVLGSQFFKKVNEQKNWHELEGYFQSRKEKEMVVQFIARDSMIVGKTLWNGGEVHLLPDTGLAFVTREQSEHGPLRLVFHRDSAGAVNQLSVSDPGNPLFVRLPNYKPVSQEEMAHTPDQLQKFAGLYHLKEDSSRYIQLTVDNNSLTIHQHWDGGIRENFVPSAEGKFFEKDFPRFTLDFSQDQQGEVTQFVALGRDVWIRTAKSMPTPDQMKTYEGKFRSVDDPDNVVQLIADGNELVLRELWNKKDIRLRSLTSTYFSMADQSYPLQIIRDDSGQVKQIILLGNQSFVRIE